MKLYVTRTLMAVVEVPENTTDAQIKKTIQELDLESYTVEGMLVTDETGEEILEW